MNRQAWLRLAIVAAAVWLSWLLRSVMVPLLAAYLLMLLCAPIHRRLRRVLGNGGSAFACTLFVVCAPLLLLLPTGRDLGKLGAYLTGADLEALRGWVEGTLVSLSQRLPADWLERLQSLGLTSEQAAERADDAAQFLVVLGQWLLAFFGGILGLVSFLVLLPVFLFYLLAGGPWPARLREELPPGWHPRFDRLLPRIEEILCSFVRSRFLVGLTKGAVAFGVLVALGFPGAYTLALLLGLFSILPVVGPLAAFVAVGLVGLADGGRTGGGLTGLGVAASLCIVLELLEGYVLLPRIVGRGLGLSDFAVVLAMLFGAVLGGFLGVLVAVPAVAVGRVLYVEFLRPVMKDPARAPKA